MIDGSGKIGGRGAGGVGFHFEHAVGLFGTDPLDHFEKPAFLKQRFAAGDDHPLAFEGEDTPCGRGGIQLAGDCGFPVFGGVRERVIFMRPGRALEVPSEIAVAPDAVEIAAGRADEDRRQTAAGTFALKRVENFRTVVEFRELHGRPPIKHE